MSKNIRQIASVLFTFIVIVIGNYVIVAQDTVLGTWNAEVKTEDQKEIHISFERKTTHGRNNHGASYNFSDFQGLSRTQTQNGKVNFNLVREAGIIEATGEFASGKGAGNFTFTPDKNFISAMKTRGFDFEKPSKNDREDEPENRLFAAAMLNVRVALADDLLSANFGKLDINDLFTAAIFKIDSKFITEMKASGFPDLGMEDLVQARIFKIDADFVREVVGMGFDKEPFESLVQMQIFKVTPEFIAEARNEGLNDLDVGDLVQMRIFKIDGEFIRQAKSEGVPLKVGELVEKRIGVWKR